MLKTDLRNILCQSTGIILLIFHAIILINLFYEIIQTIEEETNKKLFHSIQSGLTAVVCFLSYVFYVWHYNAIRSTSSKLRKIDHCLKSIGVNKNIDSNLESGPVQSAVCVILVAIYFYSKYLRNLFLAPDVSTVLILKNAFIRTYFVAVNGFIMVTFINKVRAGKRKFHALNEHVEALVSCRFAKIELRNMGVGHELELL